MQTSELTERYQRLSSAVVYDILDTMGYPNQALSSDIRPLAPEMAESSALPSTSRRATGVVAGPAFTLEEEDYRADRPTTASFYQMCRDIVPGSVLVMATKGHRVSGPWGENTSLTAQMRGARGIVIDGGTRDANPVVELGFPTFCRYVTPVFARGRCQFVSYQQPVEIAGQVGEVVTVHPGDFVIADRDGVVIVPQTLAEEVLLAAERLEEIEQQIRAGLLAGEDREVVYKRYPKFDHVRKP